MKLGLALPPGAHVVDYARIARDAGYESLWLYDSAALYEDVWVHLALVAQAVPELDIGTGVMVPNLRHPMTTASAIATVERLAPGRLTVGVGTGFTARYVLGQRALTWSATRRYIEQVQALLRGETVEIDGAACAMIHGHDWGLPRPVEVPWVVSAFGPKGQSITRELGAGLMGATPGDGSWDPYVRIVNGTVLDVDEEFDSDRVIDAMGPWQAVMPHAMWEAAPEAVDGLPGGAEWRAAVEAARPEGERHLAVHEGHVTHLTDRDRLLLGDEPRWGGWCGQPSEVRDLFDAEAGTGTAELLYTPAGSDVVREIAAFGRAVKG